MSLEDKEIRRLLTFLKSVNTVRKTCGYDKALKRAIFILLHNLFVNKKEQIILTKNKYKMILIPGDTGISSELRMCKIHEPLTTRMLFLCIQKGWTIIDVGSNIGYYVLLEARLTGKKGKIIAIEPIPSNFFYLVKNIKLNREKNIIPVNYAISNKNGKIKMIQSSYSNWCSVFTGKVPEILKNKEYKIIDVPVATLDSLVKQLKLRNVNLIRMDIEGHEYQALEGARKVVKKYHPDLLIEIHTKYLENKTEKLLQFLKNEGYQIKWGVLRDLDFLGVGSKEDIKRYSFEELLTYRKNDIMVYFSVCMSKQTSEKESNNFLNNLFLEV